MKGEEGTVVNEELKISSWLDILEKLFKVSYINMGTVSMGKVYFSFLHSSIDKYCNVLPF